MYSKVARLSGKCVEDVAAEALKRRQELSEMVTVLGDYREKMYKDCLTISLTPNTAADATRNIQNLKESLDAWRDNVKSRLDEVDLLCRSAADTMTPEQFSDLREARHQLATDYDNVVRTVEGIYTRLNVIAALLLEFSTLTSSTQSWITDRTRVVVVLKAKSADSRMLSQARSEARSFVDQVAAGESQLREVGSIVRKLEDEIDRLYEETPGVHERSINSDDVRQTFYRVQDDYSQLTRQCQELLQFQNRAETLHGDFDEGKRRLDNWIDSVQQNLDGFDSNKDISTKDRIQAMELLRSSVNDADKLDQTEQALLRLSSHLESSGAGDDVRKAGEEEIQRRKRRHSSLVEAIQQRLNAATAELAAHEGIREGSSALSSWADGFIRRVSINTSIPLYEPSLQELKKEEQQLQSELESRMAVLDQLEREADKMTRSGNEDPILRNNLAKTKTAMQKSGVELRGLRDNVNEALVGVQSLNMAGEAFNRNADVIASSLKSLAPRDIQRLAACEEDIAGLERSLNNMILTANLLKAIPNATDLNRVDGPINDHARRIDGIRSELASKMDKISQLAEAEQKFDDAKQNAAEWLGSFDGKMMELGRVSIQLPKLAEQRQQCLVLQEDHKQGLAIIEELEMAANHLPDSNVAGSRISSIPRHVMDLAGRLNSQADALRNRMAKINENEQKVIELDEAQQEINNWIEDQNVAMTKFPLPVNKNEVEDVSEKLDRVRKASRQEQKKVDAAHDKYRELARRASIPEEAALLKAIDDSLEDRWNAAQEMIDELAARNRKSEQLLDGFTQIDKTINSKNNMLKALGPPSTDASTARSQIGQIQLMKSDVEGDKDILNKLNDSTKSLTLTVDGDMSKPLLDNLDNLNKRWEQLEADLDSKASFVKQADNLGAEIRKNQKEVKKEIGQLEAELNNASTMSPSQLDEQLAKLDSLKQRVCSLDKPLNSLDNKLTTIEELGVEPMNRDDFAEDIDGVKRRAQELDMRIDSVKKAALSIKDEGAAVEDQIDKLLALTHMLSSELQQSPPLQADRDKLFEQQSTIDGIYSKLLAKEGDISLARSLAADQLKKSHDPNLKSKLDELGKTWNPLLSASKDRRAAVEKVADLVDQFNEQEMTLKNRLNDDEKEMEEVIAETDPNAVIHALRAMENVLARRQADAESLAAIVGRIENAAPGPDANKLRRKADNINDDCKNLARKAKTAGMGAQKKIDLRNKVDKLLSEASDFVSAQTLALDDVTTKEKMKYKAAEINDIWMRKGREIRTNIDELKPLVEPMEGDALESRLSALNDDFSALLSRLQDLESQLSDKQSEADRIRNLTKSLSAEIAALNDEISDLSPIGHCRKELKEQRESCEALEEQLTDLENSAKKDLEEWQKALGEGIISKPQLEANRAAIDNVNKIIARNKRKLNQRKRKIDEIEEDVDNIQRQADGLETELKNLLASESLSKPLHVADPKKNADDFKKLKDQVKSIGDKVDGFSSDCKVMVKAAGSDADTTELDDALRRVGSAWNSVTEALADRERKVDAAVQQMGHYEDAYKALLNWLEETEEMLENQKKPSADAKVDKAQLHACEVLMKHIEDKETTLDGFGALIDRIVAATPSDNDKQAVKEKENNVRQRYDRLLGTAQERQRKLMEAVDLAERLAEVEKPLKSWMDEAEKTVQSLSNAATTVDDMEKQQQLHQELEDEIARRADDVDAIDQIVPLLCGMISAEDADVLEARTGQLVNGYDSLSSRSHQIGALLNEIAGLLADFEQNANLLNDWLHDVEDQINDLDELAIEPDDLSEQTNLLTGLAEKVNEQDPAVSNIIAVGKLLCNQASTGEAIALQNKVDSLKMRYMDVMHVVDNRLGQLSKAIPLSERFHDGFDAVMQWVEAVEEDLTHVDEVDIETQAQLIFSLEDTVSSLRPEVEELVAVSNQLQALSGPERAKELYENTVEMNKRVNDIADKVARRAERIDMTERQSRAVFDDLEFIVDWLADAKERVVLAGPPSIDPDYVKAQLKNQRIMNDDVAAQKTRLREVVAEAKKLVRMVGAEGVDGQQACAQLLERCDYGKMLVDEVAALCMDRTDCLERAAILAQQLTADVEELSIWLDDVDDQLRSAPDITTATPPAELARMNQHNNEILSSIVAYKPIVDRFEMDAKAMQEVCSEVEGVKLGELVEELLLRYKEMASSARGRGTAIDASLESASGFGERLDNFVQNLQGAADRLRETGIASADPAILEEKLAENAEILENLQQKETAYEALKESANELLNAAPHGDTAAQDIVNKLGRLEELWRDIEKEAALRGEFLVDVLGRAKHFWKELDECQKAVDDLRVRLEAVEPVAGQPEQLQLQQQAMQSVHNEIGPTNLRIVALKKAGDNLTSMIPAAEQEVVRAQVDAVNDGWTNITKLYADKQRDLIAAMDEAMSFHGDLSELVAWLEGAEQHLAQLPPAERLKVDEIPAHMEELQKFKVDVDQHGVLKEKLTQAALQLSAGAPAAQAALIRQPVTDLNNRWMKLYGALADREQKVEKTLLQMGRLSEAADQLIGWIDRSKLTLGELMDSCQGRTNLRNVEILLCKLAVLRNDVHAHEPSVAGLNAAAQKLLKEESNTEAASKIDLMNSKWRELLASLEELADKMERAKREAESVGGELERWMGWLADVEHQLVSQRPPGGLPETAQSQLDDFLVLKADIDQNTSSLEGYLAETDRYITEHGGSEDSWISRNHAQMKAKWNKVKELCVDREKKLQLALQDAIALDESIRVNTEWLNAADDKLSHQPHISRLINIVEEQTKVQEQWHDEVMQRKQIMAEQHTTGTRLQYYCEKKDAIPIKNCLVSLKHRFEKIVSRTNDRGKQLIAAADDARAWHNGIETLTSVMDDIEKNLTEEQPSTSNVDRLRQQLDGLKEVQSELSAHQSLYDSTKKRGQALADQAPRNETKIITARNTELVKRWSNLLSLCGDKQQEAEQSLLEGGEFEESMKDLEKWIDLDLVKVPAKGDLRVYGDIDNVRQLKDEHSVHMTEIKAKRRGVDTVLKKAEEIIARGVEETPTVKEASDRLKQKWNKVEEAASLRSSTLDSAEKLAADFDAKANAMLDFLAHADTKLKAPVVDLDVAMMDLEQVKRDLENGRTNYDACIGSGEYILLRCHPRAEGTMQNWLRIIRNRWKEVEDRAGEREFNLLEEEQREAEREQNLKELRDFITAKRRELAQLTSQPSANDLETLEKMEKDHEHLDFELRERQPDVDSTVKSNKKGIKNPAVDQLANEWKQLWLDILGHRSALDVQRDLLEELHRLEGWRWEDWKDRYVEWNDHGKARVTDLFRRIDRSHTGNVPRDVFIDAIIKSKFPTSRLEMAKVADLFDKGNGIINSQDFINALRFDTAARPKQPVTEGEKINEEMAKQRNACSCCNKYKIEKISDGHYRFGDTQIKRMVRILRSTVMVRVGGGWEALDEFLGKHDPCRAKGRLNINLFHKDATPSNAIDTMRAFTKNRHAKVPSVGTPGPIMKIREKTERSLPMFPGSSMTPTSRSMRADSDLSTSDYRFGRPSTTGSRSSLMDNSRPPSRTGSESDFDRPTRIPSLRGRKGVAPRSYLPK